MTSVVSWVALTLDCGDVVTQDRVRAFSAEALGGEVVAGSVRARGLLLVFDVVADHRPPTWPTGDTPKQVHVEWVVEDLEQAVAVLTGLGATSASYQDPDDPALRVVLDPAGDPFCLMTTRSVAPPSRDEAGHRQP